MVAVGSTGLMSIYIYLLYAPVGYYLLSLDIYYLHLSNLLSTSWFIL